MEVNRLVLAVLGASKTRDQDLEVKARDKVGKVSQALSALLVSYIPLSSGMNAAVYVRFYIPRVKLLIHMKTTGLTKPQATHASQE